MIRIAFFEVLTSSAEREFEEVVVINDRFFFASQNIGTFRGFISICVGNCCIYDAVLQLFSY